MSIEKLKSVKNNIKKLKAVKNNIEKANRKLKEFAEREGREAIGGAFAVIFEKYPFVKQVRWTQYTPYFCDGDPCVFSTSEPGVYLEGADLDDSPYEHEANYRYYSEDEIAKYDWAKIHNARIDAIGGIELLKPLGEDIYDIWRSIPKALLEACFGDGARVTITPGSIEIEEYNDHD